MPRSAPRPLGSALPRSAGAGHEVAADAVSHGDAPEALALEPPFQIVRLEEDRGGSVHMLPDRLPEGSTMFVGIHLVEDEPSSRAEGPTDLPKRPIRILDMVEGNDPGHAIERATRERKRVRGRAHEPDGWISAGPEAQLAAVRFGHDDPVAPLCESDGRAPSAAPNIQEGQARADREESPDRGEITSSSLYAPALEDSLEDGHVGGAESWSPLKRHSVLRGPQCPPLGSLTIPSADPESRGTIRSPTRMAPSVRICARRPPRWTSPPRTPFRVRPSRWAHGSHRRIPRRRTSPTRNSRPTRWFSATPRVTTFRRAAPGSIRTSLSRAIASIASISMRVSSRQGPGRSE